jgi:hypothetical protein
MRIRCINTNNRSFELWMAILLCFVGMMMLSGCRMFREPKPAPCPGDRGIPNPLLVPMMDRWYVMDQISDELDDYFRIYREERIRVVDSVMSEGWIETHPKIGGTLFEPWKKDSTPGFQKAFATLQTVRRFAKVRVIPMGNSYSVEVKVFEELEDLPQPVGSAVTGEVLRHDDTLDIDQIDPWIGVRTPGWIPMGRDFSLEQEILSNLQRRLNKTIN